MRTGAVVHKTEISYSRLSGTKRGLESDVYGGSWRDMGGGLEMQSGVAAFAESFNDDGIGGGVGRSEGGRVDDGGVAGEQGPANAGVAGANSGEDAPWGDGA